MRYWVWNEGIADDLKTLQNVDARLIRTVGSTQLSYVKTYVEGGRSSGGEGRPYFYYGCGVGHPAMAGQELALVRWVASELAQIAPEVDLLVRPYPMLADTEMFAELKSLPNVRIDESFRTKPTDRSLSRGQILTKLALQDAAVAFLHCGTTMGFEGAYLDTPILFLAPEDFDYGPDERKSYHLRNFIHQYHNLKYMVNIDAPNVIRRRADLPQALLGVLRDRTPYLAYNRKIAVTTPLRSLGEIASEMIRDMDPRKS